MKVLGTASAQREASLPQVPTMEESGLPGFHLQIFFGVAAPAKTPAAIVERLDQEIKAITAMPEVQAADGEGRVRFRLRRQRHVPRADRRRPQALRRDHPRRRHPAELRRRDAGHIVGGGIAGLIAALSLHQIGVSCRVYDAVPRLEPIGHGINLQPNAVRELTALGLGETLASAGILTAELAFYNRHGQRIWTEPRGRDAGYRWPQISISRGKLHEDSARRRSRERLGPLAR